MNAFLELRNELKQQELEKGETEKEHLIKEKHQLQTTLSTLSEEIEFLSKKNEEFLKALKVKDFYQAYKEATDELTKLREAHAILIGMI